MKTTYKYLLLAGLVVLAASCEKEIEKESPADATTGKMITETISAQIEGATKATVDADAKFAWTVGDNIAVHVSNGTYVTSGGASVADASASFTVSYPAGFTRDAFAIFPSTIVAGNAANYGQSGTALDVTLPGTYTLAAVSGEKTPCPMIATNTPGAGWTFSQLCGLLRLTVNSIPSDATGIIIQFPGKKVNGAFSIASPVTPGTSTIASTPAVNEGDDIITITGIGSNTSVTVNLPLPTGVYDDVFITPVGSSTKVAAVRHINAGGYTAQAAHGKKLTTTMVSFTINDSNDKVVFAPGNLQAVFATAGTSCTWKFADHQYDTVADTGANTSIDAPGSVSEAGTVDLFAWVGESGTYNTYGINPNTDPNEVGTYSAGKYSPEPLKNDWGALPIGSYAVDTWRTLSAAEDLTGEWNYLIGRRTGNRFAQASVASKYGIIIFPDNYPVGPSSPNNIDTPVSWDKDDLSVYSAEEWEILESAGCIFLPCAGYSSGHNLYYSSTYASYWSSTVGNRVVVLYAYNGVLDAVHYQARSNRSSVRLVRDL